MIVNVDLLPDEYFLDSIDFANDCDCGISWYPRSPYRRVCKYCGTKELMWKEVESRWRLFDKKGNQHDCKR